MNPSIRVSWLTRLRRKSVNRAGFIAGTATALGTTAGLALLFAAALLLLGTIATAYGAYAYFTQDLPLPDEVGRRTDHGSYSAYCVFVGSPAAVGEVEAQGVVDDGVAALVLRVEVQDLEERDEPAGADIGDAHGVDFVVDGVPALFEQLLRFR